MNNELPTINNQKEIVFVENVKTLEILQLDVVPDRAWPNGKELEDNVEAADRSGGLSGKKPTL